MLLAFAYQSRCRSPSMQHSHAVCGTIPGSSKDTVKLVVFFGRYDCSADIWSLGITLLEFALGQAPLQNCNLDQILMKTLNEPPPILESSDRRKRFTEVLRSCEPTSEAHNTVACTPGLMKRYTKALLQPAFVMPPGLKCKWCTT